MTDSSVVGAFAKTEAIEERAAGLHEQVESFRCRRQAGRRCRWVEAIEDDPEDEPDIFSPDEIRG